MLRFFLVLSLILWLPEPSLFCESLDPGFDDLAQPDVASLGEEVEEKEPDIALESDDHNLSEPTISSESSAHKSALEFGVWAKEALKNNDAQVVAPAVVSNPVQPTSVKKTVAVRADLGFLGNRIRNRLKSETEMDYFDHYWLGKGSKVLQADEFSDIVKTPGAQPLTEPYEVIIKGRKVLAQKVNYYKDKEYRYALGVATVYLDPETRDPVGFFDNYNFDSRPWGTRSWKAEMSTRSVDLAGGLSGAKDYNVCYGVGCDL